MAAYLSSGEYPNVAFSVGTASAFCGMRFRVLAHVSAGGHAVADGSPPVGVRAGLPVADVVSGCGVSISAGSMAGLGTAVGRVVGFLLVSCRCKTLVA